MSFFKVSILFIQTSSHARDAGTAGALQARPERRLEFPDVTVHHLTQKQPKISWPSFRLVYMSGFSVLACPGSSRRCHKVLIHLSHLTMKMAKIL